MSTHEEITAALRTRTLAEIDYNLLRVAADELDRLQRVYTKRGEDLDALIIRCQKAEAEIDRLRAAITEKLGVE